MGEDYKAWFDSVSMTDEQLADVDRCRKAFKELISVLERNIPHSRRRSIVWTHLEEAAMMTTKAISHG